MTSLNGQVAIRNLNQKILQLENFLLSQGQPRHRTQRCFLVKKH